jgi:general secretion pathway protein E
MFEKLEDVNFEPVELENWDKELALKYFVLTAKYDNENVIIIYEKYLSKSLQFISKLEEEYPIYLTDEKSFENLYHKFLESKMDSTEIKEVEVEEDEFDLGDLLGASQDLLSDENAAPVIKMVNAIFYQAIKKGATDIHIEPYENKADIRYRIDGVLVKQMDVDKKVHNLITSRIKVISNLDISEKRIPQDGRTSVTVSGNKLDIRVSLLPTYYGERVVMRILMGSEHIPTLESLGFTDDLTEQFKDILKHSYGMFLVTGPTGSGKSTTLHSFIQQIASPDKNIITVEDPVEYNANNISQVQVNEKVGLTFASALRSILRQDPDVIMLGEIRDKETADIAIRAAMTGHFVFSTLHTNTATASIPRLEDMGIEHFLITSTVLGVLAQRLVRILCDCKVEDNEDYSELGINSKVYKAKGCAKCNFTGYKGRRAIGELFVIDRDVKQFLKHSPTEQEVRDFAIKKGMITIQERLKKLVEDGVTSMAEAVRIGIKE